MKLGLDELIIVNPGEVPGSPAQTAWFLGADGGIYRFDSRATEAALGEHEPVPRYFLGDDGILYETR